MLDLVSQIMAYESGSMSEPETLAFFQRLVNENLADRLQGHYGRTAHRLIDAGLIKDRD